METRKSDFIRDMEMIPQNLEDYLSLKIRRR